MKAVKVKVPGTPKKAARHEKLQVVARVRPMTTSEIRGGAPRCLDANTKTNEIIIKSSKRNDVKNFPFQKVYGPKTTQEEIFSDTVEQCLNDVCLGFSCTLFAYGQTGTGKTFTMEGSRDLNETATSSCHENAGIIPRSMWHLFEKLEKEGTNFTIKVSMLELYNEKLIDLLNINESDLEKEADGLKIYDNPETGVPYVGNVTEIDVTTRPQVFDILAQGSNKRKTAATQMNAQSSRSHCIFQAVVNIQQPDSEIMTTGRLYLVDLAGSENIGRSGAKGIRSKEAGNINKSLLTLGRVINLLVEKSTKLASSKISHIPYRDSQLTRLLQNALGGKSKTTMIITISPSRNDYEETVSSLEYGHRAQAIKNRPEVTETKNVARHVERLNDEIRKLQNHLNLQSTKSGGILITLERKAELEEKEEAYEQIVESTLSMKDDLMRMKEEMNEKLLKIEELHEENSVLEKSLTVAKFVTEKAVEISCDQNSQSDAFKIHGIKLSEILQLASGYVKSLSKVCKINDQQSGDTIAAVRASTSDLDKLISTVVNVISDCETGMSYYSEEQLKDYENLKCINSTFANGFEEKMRDLVEKLSLLPENTAKYNAIIQSDVKTFTKNLLTAFDGYQTDLQEMTLKNKASIQNVDESLEQYSMNHSKNINNCQAGLDNQSQIEADFQKSINSIGETCKEKTEENLKNFNQEQTRRLNQEEAEMQNFTQNQHEELCDYSNGYDEARSKISEAQNSETNNHSEFIEKGMQEMKNEQEQLMSNIQNQLQLFAELQQNKRETLQSKVSEFLTTHKTTTTEYLDKTTRKQTILFDEIRTKSESQMKHKSESVKKQNGFTDKMVNSVFDQMKTMKSKQEAELTTKMSNFTSYSTSQTETFEQCRRDQNELHKSVSKKCTQMKTDIEGIEESCEKLQEKSGKDCAEFHEKTCGKLIEFYEKTSQVVSEHERKSNQILKYHQKHSEDVSLKMSKIEDFTKKSSKNTISKLADSKKLVNEKTLAVELINNELVEFSGLRKTAPQVEMPSFEEPENYIRQNLVIKPAEKRKLENDYVDRENNRIEEQKRALEESLQAEEEERDINNSRGVVDENEYLVGINEDKGYFQKENGKLPPVGKRLRLPSKKIFASNENLAQEEISPRGKKNKI